MVSIIGVNAFNTGQSGKVLTLCVPDSYMGAGSNLGRPAPYPAPCLWPESAVKDGPKPWAPAPTWEARKKFLLLALDLCSSGH